MKNLSAFKRWYSLSETAEAINEILDESLNQDDVIELVQTGEIEAWYDARGLFAVPVSPACHLYDHPSPILIVNGYATNQHHQKGFMDFMAVNGPVRVLTEYHRMVVIDRFDAIFIPVDEEQAQMVLLGGKLLYDTEDGGFLQLVKRKTDSPSGSLKSANFMTDHLSFDKESVLIRSEDLQAAVDEAVGRNRANSLREELEAAKKRIAELEASIQYPRKSGGDGSVTEALVSTIGKVIFPYATKKLEVMVEVAEEYWANYDPARAPKSVAVAAEIDKKLGTTTRNGKPTRTAEAFAAAIRRDEEGKGVQEV